MLLVQGGAGQSKRLAGQTGLSVRPSSWEQATGHDGRACFVEALVIAGRHSSDYGRKSEKI